MNGVSRPLGRDRDVPADEPQRPRCAAARPGTSPASARTWKPLQIPSTSPPSSANAVDRAHHRAEPGDDPGPEVVAVGEAAGQDDRRDALERRLLVPQDDGLGAGQVEGVDGVPVAVAAREDDDPDADRHRLLHRVRRLAGVGPTRPLDRVGLDQRVRQELAREPLDDGARRGLVGGLDRQLHPAPDPDAADPSIPR